MRGHGDGFQALSRAFDSEADVLAVGDKDDIKNIDEATASITYVGFARPGTLDSDSLWRIQKIEVIGTVTKIRWAAGSSAYSNIWDNRASLSYS